MQTNITGASGKVNYFEADLILTNHTEDPVLRYVAFRRFISQFGRHYGVVVRDARRQTVQIVGVRRVPAGDHGSGMR